MKGQFDRQGDPLPGFNLLGTSKAEYEASDLKRFLTQQQFVMEHTLLELTRKSINSYVSCILGFLPLSTTVHDTNTVENVYYTPEQIKALGAPKPKFPLFQVDVNINDKFEPEYSTSAGEVVTEIMKIFDSGLEALMNVQLLEQKLLSQLFKSNQKNFLKVPVRPTEMPEKPDPNDKRQLPDENTWIYQAYT